MLKMADIIREAAAVPVCSSIIHQTHPFLQSGSRKRKQVVEQKSRNSSALDGAVDDLFSTPAAITNPVQSSFPLGSSQMSFGTSGEKSELVFDSEGNMVVQTVTSSTHTISGEATTTVDSATCGYDFAYRRPKPTKWSKEDTDRFYEAIEMYGSDQMLINTALPNFTPVQIRQKYKAEMRNDPNRFNGAMYAKNRKKLDSSKFEQQHGHIADPVSFSISTTTHHESLSSPETEATTPKQAPLSTPTTPGSPKETSAQPQPTGDAGLDSLFHI